ncbi:acyl carrier protein [Streptomyces clavuligerus]|uniref:Carrier domain-containing protein n=1 Tax=Streptomyces clavuligerus TaxID=1901 RepID=D5SLL8_STRCL|nr:acyl carrier protein [Streptomyces clavuligerus]EFG04811.1 Hypothetical protein SCLAV_p1325 [Streptomyces clavuligerus]MBY6306743.1 acyl carrier protein [Streptomyces clavuligerus]QCS10652.1 acyl carrier protein [Streptomyces clavuligerus]QPJ97311.1 acyl carrier protein [Streptomyces clavuligerus]WDN57364.1 acyl carrier protein [Streptomyces clavuligerus]
MDEVFEQVRDVCTDVLNTEADKVVAGARLVDDLGADSIDFAELREALAESLGVALSEDAVRAAVTVADLAALVRNGLGPRDGG